MKSSLEGMTKLELIQIVSDQKIVLRNQLSKIEFLTKEHNIALKENEGLVRMNTNLCTQVSSLNDEIRKLRQVVHTMGESVEKLSLALAHY